MTRFRKTILASALVAASLTASTPAHAYSYVDWFSGLYDHSASATRDLSAFLIRASLA